MSDRLYRVIFLNQGKVYEVYARGVTQGAMLGFVEIGDLVFGERGGVVVDPTEERLREEFEGVRRFHVPMHSVIRIDEVEKKGNSKVSDAGSNVTPFPVYYPRGSGRGET